MSFKYRTKVKSFLAFVLVIMLTTGFASAGSKDKEPEIQIFKRTLDGNTVPEIGVLGGNTISLTSEKVVFDLSEAREPFGDELKCKLKKTYTLTNVGDKRSYIPIARTMILKVKQVEVTSETAAEFDSGCSVMMDGNVLGGYIYPNNTLKKFLNESAYDNVIEALDHLDYKGCYNEAYSMYGQVSSADVKALVFEEGEVKNYYQVSDEGDWMLCTVIYNLFFNIGESHILYIEDDITGSMQRPTKYSNHGTTFTFNYQGENINSFSNIGYVNFTFALPEDNILPIISCDASRYLDDDIWTINELGTGKNITFTVGKEISKEEIADINSAFGIGRKIYNVVEVATAFLVVAAFAFVIYTVIKRKQSGIGMKLY